MGSSIFDWLNGGYQASTQQAQEAAKFADDAYMQQTQGGMAPGANVNPWGFGNSSNQGVDALATSQPAVRAQTEYNSQTGGVQQSPWLTQAASGGGGNAATAPTYSAEGLSQMGNGQVNYSGSDPALLATLNAAGAGDMTYGSSAFGIGSNYTSLANLANQTGFDSSPYKTTQGLQIALDNHLKDYYRINGLSQGWNDTGNARGANNTLYKQVDGKLVPLQTNSYEAREKGNWVEEHPGILAPLGVAAGGLAAMYGSGAGAAGASGATSGGTGTAAAAGTAGGSSGGLGGAVANQLGLGAQWGALPSWGQSALTNSVMGAANSGLRGGNILEGALLGGISGGVGSGLSSTLAQQGLSQGLSSGLGRLGGSLVSGAIGGGDASSLLTNGALNFGMGQAGNALGLSALGPVDNSLQGILTRLAAQQGGSMLAQRIDPRLGGLGGQAGGSLAALFNRYS